MNSPRPAPPFQGPVEFSSSFAPRPNIRLVVFDFDGTLSWLRHGWPEIMVQVFREQFRPRPHETEADIRQLLLDIIISLNGKPTIFQMLRFVEVMQERDGRALDAEQLRQEYQRRLDIEIERRSADIRAGRAVPDDFVVHGGRALLQELQAAGLQLAILSSTVENRVREEAELLGLTPFFGEQIFGGVGDPQKFTKRAVFERLLAEHQLSGEQLLSFGDGPVEIHDTKQLGGTAIAICSDEEENGSGRFDEFKLRQLLAAGADAALPDYRDAAKLVAQLRTPA